MMRIGAAFSDNISTGKTSRYHGREFANGDESPRQMRGYLLLVIVIISFTVIIIKLFSLQIVQGNTYRSYSDSNRIRTAIIHAPRGVIFDRNGVPLVFNIPGFRKIVHGKVVLLTREKALGLLAHGEQGLEVDALREYPFTDAFSHVLGYVGQISEQELKKTSYATYHVGDIIGKMGIESEYEDKLKGIDGKKLVEVDNLGNIVRTLGQTDPIPGQDITLTLDSKLQQVAYDAFPKGEKGAIVASTPTGQILAIMSMPSFDPNLFTLDETYSVASNSAYKSLDAILLDNQNQPLLNRTIAGTYPPGSTFKLVTAASGLDNKIIDDTYEVDDTGVLKVGEFSFANWYYLQYGKVDGQVNIIKAIQRSNDVFFYKLAEKIGVDNLSTTAKKLGIGTSLGIDLPGEENGILPTIEWKKRVIGEQWYLGDTYHYGIGQGFLLVTPLQVNSWTATIANNGIFSQPYILSEREKLITRKQVLQQSTTNTIRTGMIEACNTGGVAWPLFNFTVKNGKLPVNGQDIFLAPEATTSAEMKDNRLVSVACKTGTAQHGGEDTLPHAWITLFAPAYHPQIVLTVLVETSGEGSNVAAPIAKKILQSWFSR